MNKYHFQVLSVFMILFWFLGLPYFLVVTNAGVVETYYFACITTVITFICVMCGMGVFGDE